MGDELEGLVERARRGDRHAFSKLFQRHVQQVTGLAYRMMGRSPDLEDVVQEVFLQVHRSLGDFRGQAKFSTWLHRVAVNVVLMHRRRARSRPMLTSEEPGRDAPAPREAQPDQALDKERRIAAFHRLLEQLSDKKREVFLLHEIEGLAPADIATMVGCPVLTVRTRLFYARKELGEKMREEPALAALVRELEGSDREEPAATHPDAAEAGER
ncbi:MAG: RNA polymerase sigma factor [Deltaproteobacteria bacterium]|nr:RNA polymerase sigma factor [Deltaproteobacteria bacterium]